MGEPAVVMLSQSQFNDLLLCFYWQIALSSLCFAVLLVIVIATALRGD